MMELAAAYPESPLDHDDTAYPCKGCGEILEEGKAFELAGNRWHIDCFRCNTCNTLLDSDANLLLLGDGSLICNNCTYSCSACGNKIEDLAILTGDQAFCASCFRCRNCKKKIENLRYARTSQGIFCMECHEGLMARRRKKNPKTSSRHKHSNNNMMLLDKSLPSLPPNAQSSFSPDEATPPSSTHSDTPTETPIQQPRRPTNPRTNSRGPNRDRSPVPSEEDRRDKLTLPSTTYNRNNRHSINSQRSDISGNGEDFIPMTLDPHPAPGPSPMTRHAHYNEAESHSRTHILEKGNSRDYFNTRPSRSSSQKVSREADGTQESSRPGSNPHSQPSSPHIAYQERGREPSADALDALRKRNEQVNMTNINNVSISEKSGNNVGNGNRENEKFVLQEVPKRRRSGTSARNSQTEFPPSVDTTVPDSKSKSAPASAVAQPKEQQTIASESVPSSAISYESSNAFQNLQDVSSREPAKPNASPMINQLQHVPQRGDSLQKTPLKQGPVTRKEVSAPKSSSRSLGPESAMEHPSSASSASSQMMRTQESPTSSVNLNGGRTISKPMESPISRSSLDVGQPSSRTREGFQLSGRSAPESFVSPRVPPHPPMEINHKSRNESFSTVQSESTKNGDQGTSPILPQYTTAGELSMDEDMARILGNEDRDGTATNFLRRVSNSVRHARSYSDRGTRLSREQKWPKSPLNGNSGIFQHEISSPIASSPETREELMWLKNELRRERQRVAEQNQKIAELEAAMDSRNTIKQMNTELREKRSTMVVLDTQKEIVVRELEVLTEHIAAAKKSREPLDLGQMKNVVLREFGEELEKLKNSFTPYIEELTQKKADLMEEVAKATQQKDQALMEFEQLSSKNAQLADINNGLVSNIQELYRANAGPHFDPNRGPALGLGIYTHQLRDKNNRESQPSIAESNYTGSTILQEHEQEPTTVLTAPQIVNIRKAQPKKFNWKKGGQNVAKGVTKGLKTAFASNDTNKYQQREGSLTEGLPYGAIPQTQDFPSTTLMPRNNEPPRQTGGFFGNQKSKPPLQKMNGVPPPMPAAEHASVLFGSELEQRAAYEKVSIPGIITRCIQEVELRGMDNEGIYRKSGGTSQIQTVKEGFESSNDFDISDPDLDIAAVTSALKQYFRKLPTPLITYAVYDKLLESVTNPSIQDPQHRVAVMRSAINELPSRHKDALEFLMFHLARVVDREKENLMTALNVAVVFAPTIMRPESVQREMSDTPAKNAAVQFLIENCAGIFEFRERLVGERDRGDRGGMGSAQGMSSGRVSRDERRE